MSLKAGVLLSSCLAFTAGAAMLAAPEQNRPGDTTPARVWVENRAPNEAIPVTVQTMTPMRVQIAGTATVAVDPASTVPTRAVRQAWEYRTVTVAAGQDPASALATAGNDGWEVVVVFQPQQTTQSATSFLLKRPR
jgi:hypothetical protein